MWYWNEMFNAWNYLWGLYAISIEHSYAEIYWAAWN